MSNSPLPFASTYHTPIMVDQIMEALAVQPGQLYIDATLGGGGHTQAILEQGGQVIGADQDQQALDFVSQRLAEYIDSGQLKLAKANFRDIDTLAEAQSVAGILFDLGVSSHQLDDKSRGFSFTSEALDMRMDQQLPVDAATLVATLPQADLAKLFYDLGEERYGHRFAGAIVARRQQAAITSAHELAEIIWQASPSAYRHGPIHPATRSFQAIRLAVNAELDSLIQALPQATALLQPQGRLVVMSFHSLEDRIAKQFIVSQSNTLTPLTKKPLTALDYEVKSNPRARSAKLRVAQKIGQQL